MNWLLALGAFVAGMAVQKWMGRPRGDRSIKREVDAYKRGWYAAKADSRSLARYNRLCGEIWPTKYREAEDTPLSGKGEGWVN